METNIRIPSFNDFSPGLLKSDLRTVLNVVAAHPGDDEQIFEELSLGACAGWDARRIRTNIPATLKSTGLSTGVRPMRLSEFGKRVCNASSPKDAAAFFCAELIKNNNAFKLIEAIRNLRGRGDAVTKETFQAELGRLGVTGLSTNTTDHTTLKNWMIVAGIIREPRRGSPEIDDFTLKSLTGISSTEHDELQSLTEAQQVFVKLLRKRHIVDTGPFEVSELREECRATHPLLFDRADFRRAVSAPLMEAGWIHLKFNEGPGRGGKSGIVSGTLKLLDIPVDRVLTDFQSVIPSDLHSKLQTPLSRIREWLDSTDTYEGGLGLELLALRIILDLRLNPRDFRLRGKDSAFAEVDLTAEGNHLLFSRWTFQCKRIQPTKNVGLSEVAKEVGIAIYMKAHVIVMVSTGGFSSEAYNYAREIAQATPLQFLFLDGEIIRQYLSDGAAKLHQFVMQNAHRVMAEKRQQSISLRRIDPVESVRRSD